MLPVFYYHVLVRGHMSPHVRTPRQGGDLPRESLWQVHACDRAYTLGKVSKKRQRGAGITLLPLTSDPQIAAATLGQDPVEEMLAGAASRGEQRGGAATSTNVHGGPGN